MGEESKHLLVEMGLHEGLMISQFLFVLVMDLLTFDMIYEKWNQIALMPQQTCIEKDIIHLEIVYIDKQ